MELSRCVGYLDRLLTTSDIHKVTLFTEYKSYMVNPSHTPRHRLP
jgi:hypothetical protein